MRGKNDKGGVTIVKREEVIAGGHHGGAWKVAYADFVTAMMAFFLLMWLLNATTEAQRIGLADYFSPNNLLSHASSGTGDPFGGHTPFDHGAMVSDRGVVAITSGQRPQGELQDESGDAATDADQPTSPPDQSASRPDQTPARRLDRTAVADVPPATAGADGQTRSADLGANLDATRQPGVPRAPTQAELRAERERQERAAFDRAAEEIRAAVRDDPALRDVMKQLAIDMTPEGMRIQLLDEERRPMFATGSATPNERARMLLQKITPVLMRLPEPISLAGHTDAAPYPGPGRSNWELSTERANVTRRVLIDLGLPETRIRTVTGHADRDLLLPQDRWPRPTAASPSWCCGKPATRLLRPGRSRRRPSRHHSALPCLRSADWFSFCSACSAATWFQAVP